MKPIGGFMMHRNVRLVCSGCALAGAVALTGVTAKATVVRSVFVIAMENHNWTQPANQFTGTIQQIHQNPAAPYINSLVDGSSPISDQVAYATAYHNVLADAAGSTHVHPSEPNYLWAEAGTNFGVLNDNDPYGTNGTNQNSSQHFSTLLTKAGYTWKSYQEDIDLAKDGNGKLTGSVLPQSLWTVPLSSFKGTFSTGVNEFNLSSQYDYAAKHNPMVFFTDTNGGNDPTSANPLTSHYAPLQQLVVDLANGDAANYNWITPNQHNDMHTTLTANFEGLSGDAARIRQGDSFLSRIVPTIMASQAYQDHGLIVLWWDEAEKDGVPGDNADDLNHTLPFILISKDVHKNVDGQPYASPVSYTHSSFLRTMQ